MPRIVELECPGWRSGPLLVAVTFRERWRGVRGRPDIGLLLWARSVHGRGLPGDLAILRLDRLGTVRSVGVLRPGGIRTFRSPGWIVELPGRPALPAPGTALRAKPILAGCPAG